MFLLLQPDGEPGMWWLGRSACDDVHPRVRRADRRDSLERHTANAIDRLLRLLAHLRGETEDLLVVAVGGHVELNVYSLDVMSFSANTLTQTTS